MNTRYEPYLAFRLHTVEVDSCPGLWRSALHTVPARPVYMSCKYITFISGWVDRGAWLFCLEHMMPTYYDDDDNVWLPWWRRRWTHLAIFISIVAIRDLLVFLFRCYFVYENGDIVETVLMIVVTRGDDDDANIISINYWYNCGLWYR